MRNKGGRFIAKEYEPGFTFGRWTILSKGASIGLWTLYDSTSQNYSGSNTNE